LNILAWRTSGKFFLGGSHPVQIQRGFRLVNRNIVFGISGDLSIFSFASLLPFMLRSAISVYFYFLAVFQIFSKIFLVAIVFSTLAKDLELFLNRTDFYLKSVLLNSLLPFL
jgi:hypothetical protein